MQFNKPMGIDPIIHPIIGYIPTPTDQLRFAAQLQSVEDFINKYWPADSSWDVYEDGEDKGEEKPIQILFEEIKQQNKTLEEKYNKKIKEDFSIVMEKI